MSVRLASPIIVLSQVPMSLSVRLRRMRELVVIALTCTICFAVRACVMTSVAMLSISSPTEFQQVGRGRNKNRCDNH